MIPGTYAYQGYDLMMLFGEALVKYGTYFNDKLASEGFISGKNLSGFNYNGYNSNLFVPLIKVENNNLVIVNKKLGQSK